jgi:D-alanine-D-alanine ligase
MKITVAVFFGGKSTEHEISCISANQVLHALDSEKYDVLPVYISKDDEFFIGDELFDLANYSSFISDPSKVLQKVAIYKDGNAVRVKPLKGMFKKERTIDVAFPVVHGTNVEDGTLAGFLQMLYLRLHLQLLSVQQRRLLMLMLQYLSLPEQTRSYLQQAAVCSLQSRELSLLH